MPDHVTCLMLVADTPDSNDRNWWCIQVWNDRSSLSNVTNLPRLRESAWLQRVDNSRLGLTGTGTVLRTRGSSNGSLIRDVSILLFGLMNWIKVSSWHRLTNNRNRGMASHSDIVLAVSMRAQTERDCCCMSAGQCVSVSISASPVQVLTGTDPVDGTVGEGGSGVVGARGEEIDTAGRGGAIGNTGRGGPMLTAGGGTKVGTAGGDEEDRAAGGDEEERAAGGDPEEGAAGGDPEEGAAGGDPEEGAAGGDEEEGAAGGDEDEVAAEWRRQTEGAASGDADNG